jgi:beta-lactamase regulating signal transducer with metallopeptidase domain
MIHGLGHHLLESTAFAMAVALLPLFCMRNRGAAARHAVWLIAATKFAVPFALFSAAGVQMGRFLPTRHLVMIGSTSLSTFLPQPNSPSPSMGAFSEVSVLLTIVWLGGAGVMLSLWFSRLFASTHSTSPASDLEKESLAKMQQRIGVRRKVKLRCAKSKMEPGLVGIWHPTITIPIGLSTELARAEFEAILLHELAHAKRLDNLSSSFVHALVCLFWFHPLLWWIERKLIAEREIACDEMVVRYGADPAEYIAGILKVCRFHLSDAAAGACGITGSNLKIRMEVIMSYRSHKPVSRAPIFLLGVLASLMTIVPLAGGFLGASTLIGQTKKDNKSASSRVNPKAPVNCYHAGDSYPEGTVTQDRNGNQSMCVKDAHGEPLWVRTNNTIRERSSKVVVLPPEPPPIICEPEPSSNQQFCVCKGHGIFSEGSDVNSANGVLGCFRGEWWRPAIPAKPGQK